MKMFSCFAALAMTFAFGLSAFGADEISGKVTDADGKPVADARLIVCGPGDGWHYMHPSRVLAEGRSGADGIFHIGLPHEVLITGSSGYFVNVHKEGMSWGQSFFVCDTDGEIAMDPIIMLHRPASASGRVTDQKGEPITGARVYLRAVREGEDYVSISWHMGLGQSDEPSAETETNGAFVINDIPEGANCRFYAEAEGYTLSWSEFATAPAKDMTIKLRPECRVRGWVKDEKSGAPVAGIRLVISDFLKGAFSSSPTDAQGRFEARGLGPAEFSVHEDSRHKDPRGVLEPTPPIQLSEGQTLDNLVLYWTEGVLLSGKVINEETKKPVTDAAVFLAPPKWREEGGSFSIPCKTDILGNYCLRCLPGTYVVCIEQGPSYTQEGGRTVTLTSGSQTEDFTVKPLILRLSRLKVVDEAGKRLAKAAVEQKSNATFRFANPFLGVTDDQGQVNLQPQRRAPDGEFNAIIIVSASGDLGAFLQPREGDSRELTVTLKKTATLTGVVRKPDGSPLVGAHVKAWRVSEHLGETGSGAPGHLTERVKGVPVETDAAGRYRIGGLVAGAAYVIGAWAKGYAENDYTNMKSVTPDASAVIEMEPITLDIVPGVVQPGKSQ